jgi:hypothetical protein
VVTLQNEHIPHLTDICTRLEALAASSPGTDAAAAIADATARWAELAGHEDAGLTDRFNRAVEALRAADAPGAAVPDSDAAAGPVRDAAAGRVSAFVEREQVALPEPVSAFVEREQVALPEPVSASVESEHVALPAEAHEPAAGSVHDDAHRDGHGDAPAPAPAAPVEVPVLSADEQAERRIQLAQMLDGARQLLDATDLPDARARWIALRREWTTLVLGVELDDETVGRVREIEARIDAREAALREARTRQQHENLHRLQQMCDQLEKLAQSDRIALRDVERALREARAALDAPGPLPSRQDQQAVVGRLKAIQSALFPRVQDLREADEWERWANAGVQEALIKKLEGLREEADLGVVAKQLRHVQDEWHKVRAVPREKGRELWQRYKTVEGDIRARCEDYFQQVAVERAENLRNKEVLCEQAESLADSSDWIRTAETIKGLQAQWKSIGPVTPGHEKAIWERFRAACDRFFTRRKDDLSERKVVWTANLQKKEAICAQIEALAETADWDRAMLEVKHLQADWRTVGPVKRTRSEAILLRFRGACEKFFDNYAHRNDRETAQQAQAREQFIVQLEALLPPADAPVPVDVPENLVKDVLALKRQWDQSPGIPREQSEPLAARYAAAMTRVVSLFGDAFAGTDLDAGQNSKRLEQLCQAVESLVGEDRTPGDLSPAAILATQWREALAANTIGGRVDDEARWRNGAEEVKKAQAAWRRVGPVPDAVGRELDDRFQRACQRFFRLRDQRRKPAGGPGR